MSYWKATVKRLRAHIKIEKLRVSIKLMAKKILQAHFRGKKRHGIVVFISMNAEKICTSTFERVSRTGNNHQPDKINFYS